MKKWFVFILLVAALQKAIAQGKKNASTILENTSEQPLPAKTDSAKSNSTKNSASDSIASKKSNDESANQNFSFVTKNPMPKRAALYSALLPGLGQAYNKHYWKIPIVYAAAATSGYLYATNYTNYRLYREAFIARTDNNPSTIDTFTQYSTNNLRELERNSRATLERIVVYSTAAYGLQVIDALVSAHLRNFDLSKNISIHMQPQWQHYNSTWCLAAKATYTF